MDKLKKQATTVSNLLFSTDTRQVYTRALTLTWDILRETAVFLWLVVCSVFLLIFWGGNYAKQAGQNVRNWYANLDAEQRKNVFAAAWGSLQQIAGGGSSSRSLVDIAKAQLGISADPPALQAIPPAPPVPTKPSTPQTEPDSEPDTASQNTTPSPSSTSSAQASVKPTDDA
jgi:hypothetical protein